MAHHLPHLFGFLDQWWYVITHWHGRYIPRP